ncbi:MAG TPA: FHA domain-containing protein, partial [Pirellulaceae bacterium]|nr:FHA domain-containing protein [Pirellulaceae bacterium]
MQVKLVVVSGSTKHQQIKLRLPTVIGRGRTCTLQLPHPLVSRQHCEIYEEGGRLKVRDLGSLNGTFVSGQKVTTSDLPPGCQLGVGTVTFRVEYETSEKIPADAMPPGWTKGAKPASGQAPAAASSPTAPIPATPIPASPIAPVAGAGTPMAGRVAAPIAAPVASAIPVAGPIAPLAAPVAQPVAGYAAPTTATPVAGVPIAGVPVAAQPGVSPP